MIAVYKSHITEKNWGKEELIANSSSGYCLKIMHLNKGVGCSMHYHKLKDESFHVTLGKIYYEQIDLSTGNILRCVLNKGDTIRINPYVCHRFFGGDEVNQFIEVSTNDFKEDSYRVTQSGLRISQEDMNTWSSDCFYDLSQEAELFQPPKGE